MARPRQASQTWPARIAADPYLLVAGVLGLFLVVQTFNRQWSSDYWAHQATIEAFRRDLIHPLHTFVGNHDDSEFYTPYTFVLAVFARVSGLASVVVLQLAALFNLALFFVAFRLFVVEITGRKRAAAYALVATVVFWGVVPWRWSGFLNLNSIGFGLPFPSMFATDVALLLGWALLRYAETESRRWLVFIGVGWTVMALSHPFTTVWATLMLGALAISRGLIRRRTLVPLVVAAVGALVLAALWPYYSFFHLLTGGTTAGYATLQSKQSAPLYGRVPVRLIAALPGVAIVVRRFQRNRLDALVLMFVAGAVPYSVGLVTNDSRFGRMLPLVLLPVHIALGVLLAAIVSRPRQIRRPLVLWVAVSGIVGLVGAGPGLARMVPIALVPQSILRSHEELEAITKPYSALQGALPNATVTVVENPLLATVAPAYGIAELAPRDPVAFVPDLSRRIAAQRRILNPATGPRARAQLLRQYDVRAVLCSTARCRTIFEGAPVAREHGSWTLFRIASSQRR